jgi:hypothetical protein
MTWSAQKPDKQEANQTMDAQDLSETCYRNSSEVSGTFSSEKDDANLIAPVINQLESAKIAEMDELG